MHNPDFKLKPSKIYLIFMTSLLLASAGIIYLLPILSIWRLLGLIVLTVYGGYIIWHFGLLRSDSAIISIRQEKDGRWYVKSRTQDLPAEILGDSIVTSLVTVLRLRLPNHWLPKSCIVLRDSLELDVYRRLLVMLRMM